MTASSLAGLGNFPSGRFCFHRRLSPLRWHWICSFPFWLSKLSSMAAYPLVLVQKSKDVPLPSACQPYFAQSGCKIMVYFFPLHSRTFLFSSTRSGYVFPSTLHE